MIGVTGGTASGKTTICNSLIKRLSHPFVAHISMDSFYRPLTPEERRNIENVNFDIPAAFDWPLFLETLKSLKYTGAAEIPQYSFAEHARLPTKIPIQGADVVVVEGILVLYDKQVRELFSLKIFVDADSDLRLARRLLRDISERGRTVDSVIQQYLSTVKPAFDDYIFPTKLYADMVVPGGSANTAIINLLGQYIEKRLQEEPQNSKNLEKYPEKFTDEKLSGTPGGYRGSALGAIELIPGMKAEDRSRAEQNKNFVEKFKKPELKSNL